MGASRTTGFDTIQETIFCIFRKKKLDREFFLTTLKQDKIYPLYPNNKELP
jgi:hypothetical protein